MIASTAKVLGDSDRVDNLLKCTDSLHLRGRYKWLWILSCSLMSRLSVSEAKFGKNGHTTDFHIEFVVVTRQL